METGRPKLNFSLILIMIAVGLIAAAAFYQAQVKGLIPSKGLFSPQKSATTNQTQTVVQEENAVISVVDKVSPSVVAIGVSQRASSLQNPFNPFSRPRPNTNTNINNTIGTGFVVSDKGIIVTNKHVVSDTGVKYTVITKDGQKLDVQKIYRDPILDLAMVQVSGGNLKPLEFGDSSKLQVGQTAIAIGNALGEFTNTVTTGVISGLGRKVEAGDPYSGSAESLDNLIQTDAAINPGNSGGPLLNSAGQVIGVNVATTEGAQNIGFAIPINAIKPIINQFLTQGFISRPFLGVSYRFISKDVALLNDVPQGAYIQQVIDSSPADKAGVKQQDIITKINGTIIDAENKLSSIIAQAKVGDKLTLNIWRDGQQLSVIATLEESPNQ